MHQDFQWSKPLKTCEKHPIFLAILEEDKHCVVVVMLNNPELVPFQSAAEKLSWLQASFVLLLALLRVLSCRDVLIIYIHVNVEPVFSGTA